MQSGQAGTIATTVHELDGAIGGGEVKRKHPRLEDWSPLVESEIEDYQDDGRGDTYD
jgi:hypothetical protein